MRNYFYVNLLAYFLFFLLAGSAAADVTVSPAIGPTGGGNVVLISGLNEIPSDFIEVRFGGIAAPHININWEAPEGMVISAIAPPHAAGAVDIVIYYHDPLLTIENAFTYSASAASVTTSIVNDVVTSTIPITFSGGSVTMTFPPGAFGSGAWFQQTMTETSDAPSGMAFAGDAFSLDAFINGQRQDHFTFLKLVQAAITYLDSTITGGGIDEGSLELLYRKQGSWSRAGITTTGRSSGSNMITATLSHLSTFALMGTTSGTSGQTGGTGSTGGGGGSSGCFVSTLF